MEARDQVQTKALKLLLNENRAGIGITMGGGKTLIGLKHMNMNYHKGSKFLIVGPTKAILKTWVDEAEKHNMEYLIPYMSFSTYRSLIKQSLDYEIIYLDECHSLLFSHTPYLSKYKGRIIGLTGTPPRFSNSEKGTMVNTYCPIIYKYTTDAAVNDNILNDYRIVIHHLNLSNAKTFVVKNKNGNSWVTSEKASYDYWTKRIDAASTKKEKQIFSIMRMKAMMTYNTKEEYVKKMLEDVKDKVIVFANTQEQADIFCIPSYHSSNKESEENLERFKSNQINQLSCVLQLNEGVNIPNLKCGIIMHSYGNERKSSQRIGRLLRLNPNDCATAHILCYRNTIDEVWVNRALENFDSDKITNLIVTCNNY